MVKYVWYKQSYNHMDVWVWTRHVNVSTHHSSRLINVLRFGYWPLSSYSHILLMPNTEDSLYRRRNICHRIFVCVSFSFDSSSKFVRCILYGKQNETCMQIAPLSHKPFVFLLFWLSVCVLLLFSFRCCLKTCVNWCSRWEQKIFEK